MNYREVKVSSDERPGVLETKKKTMLGLAQWLVLLLVIACLFLSGCDNTDWVSDGLRKRAAGGWFVITIGAFQNPLVAGAGIVGPGILYYTMQDVIRIVSDIAGEDVEPFFRNYVSGLQALPLAEYFGEAGLDVEVEFGEKLPSLFDVCQIFGVFALLLEAPEGVILDRLPPGKTFANLITDVKGWEEDKLLAIDGVPVQTLIDVRTAAKGWKVGDVVVFTLERKGKPLTQRVRLRKGTFGELSTPGEVIVVITKRKNRTDSQRAILSGILGTLPNGN